MSQDQQDQLEAMFPQEAYDVLVETAHAPVFFEKLARDHNIVPKSVEARRGLLELAGILRDTEAEEVKEASDGDSFILEAADGLKTALKDTGRPTQTLTTHERNVKAAAAGAIQNPYVKEAALQYGSWLAQLQQAADEN